MFRRIISYGMKSFSQRCLYSKSYMIFVFKEISELFFNIKNEILIFPMLKIMKLNFDYEHLCCQY